MTTQISKRALTAGLSAGLGAGALALLAQTQRASADTPFTGFPFAATGAPTARTMPDRLNDVVNVKDWGAKGDSVTDDTRAIQAAVDAHNGTIFFPPGRYKVTGEIILSNVGNSNHVFQGSGVGDGVHATAGTQVFGGVNGWLFKHDSTLASCNGVAFKDMRIKNQATTFGGCIKINFGDGIDIGNCIIEGFNGVELGGTYPMGIVAASCIHSCVFVNSDGTGPSGSVGIMIGPHVAVIGCSIVNFDHGIRSYSTGGVIFNTRTEVNRVGFMLGMDRTGAYIGANAKFIAGCTFEANLTNVEIINAANITMHDCFLQHGDNALAGGHTLYGMKLHALQNCSFNNVNVSTGGGQIADFWISNDTGTPVNVYFDRCSGGLTQDGSWSIANVTQQNCLGFPSLATTVSLLPGNAGNNALGTHSYPVEGQWKIVTDASNASAARGTIVAGGGASKIPVIYIGGNWCVG